MKYCEEYATLLDAFVDGELSEETAVRVREHLGDCADCRSYVEAALAIRAAFPQAEDSVVPDGFAEGVMAAVRLESRKHKKTPWSKILLPMAACLALVVATQTLPLMEAPSAAPADSALSYTSRSEDAAADTFTAEPKGESTASAAGGTTPEESVQVQAPQAPAANDAPKQLPTAETPPPESAAVTAPPPNHAIPANAPPTVMATRTPVPTLVLTQSEAGTLLADFTGYAYQEGTLAGTIYELTGEEYAALLPALPETVTPPPAPDAVPILVLVTA